MTSTTRTVLLVFGAFIVLGTALWWRLSPDAVRATTSPAGTTGDRAVGRTAAVPTPGPIATDTDRQLAGGADLGGFVVVVNTADTKPLANAEVSLRFDSVLVTRETSPDGRAGSTYDKAKTTAARIAVSMSGYATAYRLVRAPLPPEIVINLTLEGTLHGKVVLASGKAPPAQLSVMAWPRSRMPTEPELKLMSRGSQIFPVGSCSPDGRFTLTGLDPKAAYKIIAVGGPYASADPVVASAGDAETVILVSTFW